MEKKGKPVNNEISHLLNKIVELEKQNESLKKENNDLKAKLSQAEAKIQALQTSPTGSSIAQTKNEALAALDNLDKEINQIQKRASVSSDSELMLKVLGENKKKGQLTPEEVALYKRIMVKRYERQNSSNDNFRQSTPVTGSPKEMPFQRQVNTNQELDAWKKKQEQNQPNPKSPPPIKRVLPSQPLMKSATVNSERKPLSPPPKRPPPKTPGETLKFSAPSSPSTMKRKKTLDEKPHYSKERWIKNLKHTPTQRDEIAHEIFSSEKAYVKSLKIIIKMYKVPLSYAATSESPILSQEEIVSIFSNIEIIFNFNKEFLDALEQRIKFWTDSQKIGDTFVRMIPFMKTYFDYCKNFEASRNAFTKALGKVDFKTFLETRKKMPASNLLDLSDLLIMPVQRIPRYQLLLTDIQKHTPHSHPDYTDITSALDNVKKIASELNDFIKRVDNTVKIISIQNNFAESFVILEPSRMFIREGPAMVNILNPSKKFNGHLFLFNDMIVVGKKGILNYSLEEKIFLVNAFTDQPQDVPDPTLSFQVSSSKRSFVLTFKSEDEKLSWMDEINVLRDLLLEREGANMRAQIMKKHGTAVIDEESDENKRRSSV